MLPSLVSEVSPVKSFSRLVISQLNDTTVILDEECTMVSPGTMVSGTGVPSDWAGVELLGGAANRIVVCQQWCQLHFQLILYTYHSKGKSILSTSCQKLHKFIMKLITIHTNYYSFKCSYIPVYSKALKMQNEIQALSRPCGNSGIEISLEELS